MPLTRRQFTQATAGGLMLTHVRLPMGAHTDEGVHVVFTNDPLGRAFACHLGGSGTLTRQLRLPDWHSGRLDALRRALQPAAAARRVVGLVGSDCYPILESLLRDAAGRVLLHGRHVGRAGSVAHDFYSTPSSAGIGAWMERALAAAGSAARVREITLASADADVLSSVAPRGADWIEATAHIALTVGAAQRCGVELCRTESADTGEKLPARFSVETFSCLV